jgi:hypothetical protein
VLAVRMIELGGAYYFQVVKATWSFWTNA